MIDQIIFKILKFFNLDYFNKHRFFYFLPYVNESIDAELFFTNLIQSTTSRNLSVSKFKLAVLKYENKDNSWKFIKFLNFNKLQYINISIKDLNASVGDMYLFFPVKESFRTPKELNKFPDIFLKQKDFSPHTIRGKLSFISKKSRTSYMSDYPFHMSQIKIGSSFCLPDMLVSSKAETVFLIFISITERISATEKFFIDIIDIQTNKLLGREDIQPNFSNVINLKKYTQQKFYIKANTVGIPIFLNMELDANGNISLNVEHTHPPSELFFDRPYLNQSNIKKNWFNRKI